MKSNQLLLAISFTLIGAIAQAQPTKGSVLIGGNLGFAGGKYNGGNTPDPLARITLSPLAAYFLSDRIAIGGKVSPQLIAIGSSVSGGEGGGFITVSLGPLARYYFNNKGSTRFFGQGSLNWLTLDSTFGFGLSAGLDYFFNEHVALEAFLDYEKVKFEKKDNEASNFFGICIGMVWVIGGREK